MEDLLKRARMAALGLALLGSAGGEAQAIYLRPVLQGLTTPALLTNAGDAHSYGVEAELTYIHRLQNGTLRMTLGASAQDGEVTSGQYDGLTLPQVPEFLGSVTLNYRHNFNATTSLNTNLFYSVQSGGVQELRLPEVPLDDFDLLNLRAGVDIGQFSIAVFANNVLDERYIIGHLRGEFGDPATLVSELVLN